MTLLVIEDHPVLRSRLMEHFTRAGFAAGMPHPTVQVRLATIRITGCMNAVIFDLGLPDMDGISTPARRAGTGACSAASS